MDNVHLYAPIDKADDEQRMVYGYASTESLDSQNEIVKKSALQNALEDYMKYANIREMHQPSAVGKTKQANLDKNGLYIAVKVVDDKAWEKVKEGVYNGFSIGGRVLQQIDNEITDLKLSEISLVDRPANPDAVFDVCKWR
jgi:HK97 family phage prohead protease